MKVIFEKSMSCYLLVYIHCETAAEQHKLSEKLFTHSEYQSKWDALCDEWIQKEYFKFVNKEELIGRSSVITTLTFIDGRNDDFIKELSNYFEDQYVVGGYYKIEYKSFTN